MMPMGSVSSLLMDEKVLWLMKDQTCLRQGKQGSREQVPNFPRTHLAILETSISFSKEANKAVSNCLGEGAGTKNQVS